MKHLFIMNPNAGALKGRVHIVEQAIGELNASLQDKQEVAELYKTSGEMDACRKIKEEAKLLSDTDMLYVYACGGDGTLNECVNGAAERPNIAVTQYPCGTGNDFLKTFLADNPDYQERFQDLRALSQGVVKPLDLILCEYAGPEQGIRDASVSPDFTGSDIGAAGPNECNRRYGINICSVGIDARVGTDVHKYSGLPVIGRKGAYIVSLIVNVIKGVTQDMKITTRGETGPDGSPCEDKVFDRKLTLACACNGRYYGGGFNPVPDALPDNGILECLIVDAVSRFKVAGIVGKYAAGGFAELPDIIHHVRCTEMEISAGRGFVVNIDGEGVYTFKVTFKLMPKAVNFLFPAGVYN